MINKTASDILLKHEDSNEYHFHDVDRKWIIEAMEEYASIKSIELTIELTNALKDIKNWDEDLEDEWGDAGERASEALNKYYKIVIKK